MYFLQAFTVPTAVVIGDVYVEIPKFTVRDFASWGQEIQQKMIDQATAHLDDEKKTEFLSFYPVLPPTRQELRRMAATDEGMEKIIKVCLQKASFFTVKMVKKTRKVGDKKEQYEEPTRGEPCPKKDDSWIDELIVNNTGRMGHLAVLLADMNDTSMNLPPIVAKREQKEQEEEEGEQDPLSKGGTGGETQ